MHMVVVRASLCFWNISCHNYFIFFSSLIPLFLFSHRSLFLLLADVHLPDRQEEKENLDNSLRTQSSILKYLRVQGEWKSLFSTRIAISRSGFVRSMRKRPRNCRSKATLQVQTSLFRLHHLLLRVSFALGIIPEWINGCFYQNGPGLLDVTGRRVEHLFDAFALIQK